MKKKEILLATDEGVRNVDRFCKIAAELLKRKLRGNRLRKPPAAELAKKVDAVIYVPDEKEKRHGRTAQKMA